MNLQLARTALQEIVNFGCCEFIVCPGARNTPLINVLINEAPLKKWWGFEERSSCFFALGRARGTLRPVAIVTTSGTAVAELLPAVMEAYYTQVPLILITADRPRRFRFVNAPQTCNQKNIFGDYTPFSFDLDATEEIDLSKWDLKSPLHVNLSFEEPEREKMDTHSLNYLLFRTNEKQELPVNVTPFVKEADKLLTLVSTLPKNCEEAVLNLLNNMGGDVYAEGISGIREKVKNVDPILANYSHVLRIGGVPTHRIWRDIEEQRSVKLLSVTSHPFAGISWGDYLLSDLKDFVYNGPLKPTTNQIKEGSKGLFHKLSIIIPEGSLIYLGNSLPIRNWDREATLDPKNFEIKASRGLNGIDGQISTFLGLVEAGRSNFALLGDLTTLYDLAGPWFLPQMEAEEITIFVINNHGGRIFEPLFPMPEMINEHKLSFEPLAKMWGLKYEKWDVIPDKLEYGGRRLVEIIC